jgi:ubiquinone/menaquinone biosynthesis C-methylase UbiE
MMTTHSVDWDRYALCYDSLSKLSPYAKMMKDIADKITQTQGALLDASCGTGNLIAAIEALPRSPFQIVGVDASEEMLRRATKKTSASVLYKKCNLDAPLPFEDSSFEQVASINTLYAVKDPSFTLSQFRRVLKRDGQLFLVTPKHGFENGFILKDHAGSTLPDDHWVRAHDSPEREELLIRQAITDESMIESMLHVANINRLINASSVFHFFTEDALIKNLSDLGFEVVEKSMTYANQAIFIRAVVA